MEERVGEDPHNRGKQRPQRAWRFPRRRLGCLRRPARGAPSPRGPRRLGGDRRRRHCGGCCGRAGCSFSRRRGCCHPRRQRHRDRRDGCTSCKARTREAAQEPCSTSCMSRYRCRPSPPSLARVLPPASVSVPLFMDIDCVFLQLSDQGARLFDAATDGALGGDPERALPFASFKQLVIVKVAGSASAGASAGNSAGAAAATPSSETPAATDTRFVEVEVDVDRIPNVSDTLPSGGSGGGEAKRDSNEPLAFVTVRGPGWAQVANLLSLAPGAVVRFERDPETGFVRVSRVGREEKGGKGGSSRRAAAAAPAAAAAHAHTADAVASNQQQQQQQQHKLSSPPSAKRVKVQQQQQSAYTGAHWASVPPRGRGGGGGGDGGGGEGLKVERASGRSGGSDAHPGAPAAAPGCTSPYDQAVNAEWASRQGVAAADEELARVKAALEDVCARAPLRKAEVDDCTNEVAFCLRWVHSVTEEGGSGVPDGAGGGDGGGLGGGGRGGRARLGVGGGKQRSEGEGDNDDNDDDDDGGFDGGGGGGDYHADGAAAPLSAGWGSGDTGSVDEMHVDDAGPDSAAKRGKKRGSKGGVSGGGVSDLDDLDDDLDDGDGGAAPPFKRQCYGVGGRAAVATTARPRQEMLRGGEREYEPEDSDDWCKEIDDKIQKVSKKVADEWAALTAHRQGG